jgi:hypothetical protein
VAAVKSKRKIPLSQSEVMFVARGRTMVLNGTSQGPGAMVTLPADEAARM